jgi:hypothetical protein
LVTLLNTKNSLEEQIAVLRKQCADLEEGLHADTSDISALRSENSLLEGKVRLLLLTRPLTVTVRQVTELERDNEDFQRELAEARLELEKLRLEGERNRLQFEQSAGDYLREKDQSLKRETQVSSADRREKEGAQESLTGVLGCHGRGQSPAAREGAAAGLCSKRRKKKTRCLARAPARQ